MLDYFKDKSVSIKEKISIIYQCCELENCKKYINLFDLKLKNDDMIKILWDNGYEKGIKDLNRDILKIYTLYILCNNCIE